MLPVESGVPLRHRVPIRSQRFFRVIVRFSTQSFPLMTGVLPSRNEVLGCPNETLSGCPGRFPTFVVGTDGAREVRSDLVDLVHRVHLSSNVVSALDDVTQESETRESFDRLKVQRDIDPVRLCGFTPNSTAIYRPVICRVSSTVCVNG